jgi:hypothetical protein
MKKILNKPGLCIFLFFFIGCLPVNAAKRQMEYLDRGLTAVKVPEGVYLSWRYLGTDDPSISFNLYRNGEKVNTSPIATKTNYTDTRGTLSSTYTVKEVVNGIEQEASKSVPVWAQQYKKLQLRKPADGTNTSGSYTYTPNDCSVGDVDGDGEYEIILKWDPSNSKDNSQSGYTGNVYLDCYKLDGTFMWRIDLGINIRAGAHYTQFQVYDLDGDGKAEIVCKTAPGTIDGKGNYVLMGSDDPAKDYRNSSGYVLSGPEYLTVFEGKTGGEIHTVAYNPPRGTVSSWGDNYGNRVDRFLACVAYLDGVHPSVVMCRGYYTRSTLAAYDFKDGKLVQRWYHNSDRSGTGAYGEGYHNLAVADIDGDGLDEIIYGSACIDHDGKLLYRTGFGHGDAMHVSDLDPGRPGLEGWFVHEDKNNAYGFELRDLKTGQVIFGEKTGTDVGRGLAADIDPRHPGFEMWSTGNGNVYNAKGNVISTKRPSVNFRIYWDGDLQDELLDGTKLDKWNGNGTDRLLTIYDYEGAKEINGTKANPCLLADLFGDWREEMIFYNWQNPGQLIIFTTVIPSEHRLFTLMHDPVYRTSVAWQNTAYNQPPHLGFYIGGGLEGISQPDIYTVKAGDVSGEPELIKQGSGSSIQTIQLGNPVEPFSYRWVNATTVSVEGIPDGIDIVINNAAKTVSFSGTPEKTGTYPFTVTTVGNTSTPATKSGTITVENGTPEPATIGRWGSGGARNQTVTVGNPIQTIVFNFTNASSIDVIGDLPEGITATIEGQQLFIGGTPHEVGVFSFTLKTVGGQPEASDPGGNITVQENTQISKLDSEGELYQEILEGNRMEEVIFTWGAGTSDVRIEGLPEELTATKEGKSLTIKGTPLTSAHLTVSSVGNGEPITIELFLSVIPANKKKIAYITDQSAINYTKDVRILPAFKALPDLYIKEIDAQQQGVDFSIYDLVVISEVPYSTSPITEELKNVGKPVLNMKVHAYKNTEGAWKWADNGFGDNQTATSIVVNPALLNHPMFKEIVFTNGNEIKMVSEVNTKAITYMNPGSFLGVSGGTITAVANIKDENQTCILEIPAGTTVAGTTLTGNFIQIGLNSSSYENITDEGISVILNACYYLLGIDDDPVDTEQNYSGDTEVDISATEEKILVTIRSFIDENISFVLYDVKGYSHILKYISHTKGDARYELDTSNLPAGMYVLVVTTMNSVHQDKVLLK